MAAMVDPVEVGAAVAVAGLLVDEAETAVPVEAGAVEGAPALVREAGAAGGALACRPKRYAAWRYVSCGKEQTHPQGRRLHARNLMLRSEGRLTLATDEVFSHREPCPCGKSTVTRTERSPDHGWARPNQTTHEAEIDCPVCMKTHVPYSERPSDRPAIVPIAHVEAKGAAEQAYRDLEKQVEAAQEAERLRQTITTHVDAAKSMKAKHGLLYEMGLCHASYSTYRKRPSSGREAAQAATGSTLARIGSGTLGGSDSAFFRQAATQLEAAQQTRRACEAVLRKLSKPR